MAPVRARLSRLWLSQCLPSRLGKCFLASCGPKGAAHACYPLANRGSRKERGTESFMKSRRQTTARTPTGTAWRKLARGSILLDFRWQPGHREMIRKQGLLKSRLIGASRGVLGWCCFEVTIGFNHSHFLVTCAHLHGYFLFFLSFFFKGTTESLTTPDNHKCLPDHLLSLRIGIFDSDPKRPIPSYWPLSRSSHHLILAVCTFCAYLSVYM